MQTTGVVPHPRLRRTIAARLTESKLHIPHFYVRGTARVDALLALRAELNSVAQQKISVNDLVLKAVALAHTAIAGVNATWTDEGMREFDTVDVGVAVATDGRSRHAGGARRAPARRRSGRRGDP